jgi:hypothetical protein
MPPVAAALEAAVEEAVLVVNMAGSCRLNPKRRRPRSPQLRPAAEVAAEAAAVRKRMSASCNWV